MAHIDLSDLARQHSGSPHLRGYLARPSGEGPWPGVVVLHEAYGINEVMLRQADRMAAAGYLALMPDLFSEGGAVRCVAAAVRAVVSGHGRAFHDIEVARRWLLAREECTGRIGVIGFCLGGGFALLAAARGFEVSAPNYGVLPRDLGTALAGACPLVASYAGRDRPLRGAARRLEAALTGAGIAHDVKEYEAAGHSFLNDAETGPRVLRPIMRVAGIAPHPESAADAWRRIEAFFAEYLRHAGEQAPA